MADNATAGADTKVRAFVIISVEAPSSQDVIAELRLLDEVVEAGAVYGEMDVVASVEVSSLTDLQRLVMDRMQSIRDVNETQTYIVIEGEDMHFRRPSR